MDIKILKQAYRKLKSYLYTDKSLLGEKIEIARFEQNLESSGSFVPHLLQNIQILLLKLIIYIYQINVNNILENYNYKEY